MRVEQFSILQPKLLLIKFNILPLASLLQGKQFLVMANSCLFKAVTITQDQDVINHSLCALQSS